MADGGNGPNDEEWQRMKSARKIQELFHGRFTFKESCNLMRRNDWDETRTLAFILKDADPEEIRDAAQDEDDWQLVVKNVRKNKNPKVDLDAARRKYIETEFRQFGCPLCDHMWWAKVPTRKPVSRCSKCPDKHRYDPIPREHEWGWATFKCPGCGHDFYGFGTMGRSQSKCRQCDNLCKPLHINPPLKKSKRHNSTYRPQTHSCTGSNCYNKLIIQNPPELVDHHICAHPKSIIKLIKKVIEPSDGHVSTVATVKTFLSQDDLEEPYDFYEPSLADVDEVLDII